MKTIIKTGELSMRQSCANLVIRSATIMSYTDKKQIVKLISYMATFDGGIYLPNPKGKSNKNVNAHFIMNMRAENRDYLEWVKEALDTFTSAKIEDRPDYNKDGFNRAPQLRLQSRRHPFLTKIRNRVYIDRHKVIDPHMLKLMDAEALAIIFMADGGSCLDKRWDTPHARLSLNTKGFSYNDNMAISKSIYDKFGIRSTVCRHNKYYYINIKAADNMLFINTVAPYIKKSFLYKLERIAPYIKRMGGDMIWASGRSEEHGRNDHA